MDRINAAAGLSCFAVVPRDNAPQALFPLNLAFAPRREIRAKDFVANIHSLMRAFVIVVRQPLAIDVVELVKAQADKMVQALFLNDAYTRFAISVWRCNQLHLIGVLKHKLFV